MWNVVTNERMPRGVEYVLSKASLKLAAFLSSNLYPYTLFRIKKVLPSAYFLCILYIKHFRLIEFFDDQQYRLS